MSPAAIKAEFASRIFGNAVAGARSSAAAAKAGAKVGAASKAIVARGGFAQRVAAGGSARGRGNVKANAVSNGAALLKKASEISFGPARAGRAASRRASPYDFDDLPPEEPRREEPWESNYFSSWEIAWMPRWQHDQFDGPRTVGSSVFVRNLPDGATSQQLAGLFSAVGQITSVQVDNGPLPTASVEFVRRDAAEEAERRFHGRWLQGAQLKVSMKADASANGSGDDEEFWRRELKAMPPRAAQISEDGLAASIISGKAAANLRRSASDGDVQVRGRGSFAYEPATRRPDASPALKPASSPRVATATADVKVRGRGQITAETSAASASKVRGRGNTSYQSRTEAAPEARERRIIDLETGGGAPSQARGRGSRVFVSEASRESKIGKDVTEVRGRGSSKFVSASSLREEEAEAPDAFGAVRRPKTARRAEPYDNGLRSRDTVLDEDNRKTDRAALPNAVFVRGLRRGVSAEQLGGIFAAAGKVNDVEVEMGPLPTAVVSFKRPDAVDEAVRRFHGEWLKGSQLKVRRL